MSAGIAQDGAVFKPWAFATSFKKSGKMIFFLSGKLKYALEFEREIFLDIFYLKFKKNIISGLGRFYWKIWWWFIMQK